MLFPTPHFGADCSTVAATHSAASALQLGIATELIQLWGQSIDSERSKLKDEKFFSGENEQVQAEILSRLLVRIIAPRDSTGA